MWQYFARSSLVFVCGLVKGIKQKFGEGEAPAEPKQHLLKKKIRRFQRGER